MKEPFKKCTMCARHWQKMGDLIRDKELFVNGYHASFNDAHEGLFLLTHDVDGGGTTFAITAGSLKKLYAGPEHAIHMALTDRCEGHCLNQDDLGPCPNECDTKWARDILQILKNHGPEEFLKTVEETSCPEPISRSA